MAKFETMSKELADLSKDVEKNEKSDSEEKNDSYAGSPEMAALNC